MIIIMMMIVTIIIALFPHVGHYAKCFIFFTACNPHNKCTAYPSKM